MAVKQVWLDKGTLDGSPLPKSADNYKIQIINGLAQRIHTVVVYSFTLNMDLYPNLFPADTLRDWQHSQQGQWILAHAIEQPIYRAEQNYTTFDCVFYITAKLIGRDYTFWTMKWAGQNQLK